MEDILINDIFNASLKNRRQADFDMYILICSKNYKYK